MAKKKGAKQSRANGGPAPKATKKQIEAYTHADKRRSNNPPVGLVTAASDPPDPPKKKYEYDPHLDPQLVWAGKAEHTSFQVPTISLHVHERIDPKTIIAAVRVASASASGQKGKGKPSSLALATSTQLSLFESREQNPPLRDALDFYKHPHGWTNRLVAGDSLLVMNSLLEKEGMAGKVQMIYIDPPYGIRYGSNFQPFTNRRDVKDGRDEDLTQEPETLKAFRDTWELGIHSYLTHLRDRLLLARELLHESGSVFVQISDENLHHVREMGAEIFGAENLVAQITFKKTAGATSRFLASTCDYLVWFARDVSRLKYRPFLLKRSLGDDDAYAWVELPDGTRRRLTKDEFANPESLPRDAKPFTLQLLQSQRQGRPSGPGSAMYFNVDYEGKSFVPSGNRGWTTTAEGMNQLRIARRFEIQGNSIRYVRYLDDFPAMAVTNVWADTQSGSGMDKVYVVQTTLEVIKRCLLMTTDPGDIVLDPTCGSGTTAYVAEQWGRRWITCDTSRVAVTLAKQRLMTAVYDYYALARPDSGVGGGFKYKTVPHVTLKSIANNPDIRPGLTRAEIDAAIARHADQETLYDQPEVDRSKARVTGPFTVEAVPAVNVRPVETVTESRPLQVDLQARLLEPDQRTLTADTSVSRYGETLRQTEWRDELARTGVRGKGGEKIEFVRLETLPACRYLNAIGETKEARPKTVVVSFGPEHAPLEQTQVSQALDEAESLRPKPQLVLFAAFHFDPEAAKDIDETKWPGVELLKLQMNTDLLTDDLKKKRASNESFWLIGQPDVDVRKVEGGYVVAVHGFDYYSPSQGTIESGDTSKIAMWLLDTDYDGRSLFPRQVFFPLSGEKDGWTRLAKNLKAEIDEELIEAYRGVESLPFAPGPNRRIAVKIVDDRGIESLKVMGLDKP